MRPFHLDGTLDGVARGLVLSVLAGDAAMGLAGGWRMGRVAAERWIVTLPALAPEVAPAPPPTPPATPVAERAERRRAEPRTAEPVVVAPPDAAPPSPPDAAPPPP